MEASLLVYVNPFMTNKENRPRDSFGWVPSFFLVLFFLVVILIVIQIIWRIVRKPSPAEPSPQPTVIKETVREVVKIRCPYCGNLYDEGLDRWPHCGGKR